jgi:DNA primase
MTNWLDFKELRKQLDFGKVLQHYGVELKLSGDQHHGFCPLPLHNGKKNSPSFSANLKRGIWQCFGCGEKGNVLDFAVLMERKHPKNGKDVREVAAILESQVSKGALPAKAETRNEPEEVDEQNTIINAPLDFELKGLDANHPYLFNRGFSKETIERFGLGYCSRGLLTKRIAVPLHDACGKLIGYVGRVVNDEEISEDNPKYKFPGRRKRKNVIHDFRKSLLLYNEHRIARAVFDLVVVEGFTGVWWLTQAGIEDVVAPMGASCSEEQGDIIVSLVKPEGRVWIFTDGDSAGNRCARDILVHVSKYRFVRRFLLVQGMQPTSLSATELQSMWRGRP